MSFKLPLPKKLGHPLLLIGAQSNCWKTFKMALEAKTRQPEDIHSGDKHRFEIEVDLALVTAFAQLSGDFNPLHVNPDFARSVGYKTGVAHGALQVAWASQAAGMWLIGAH